MKQKHRQLFISFICISIIALTGCSTLVNKISDQTSPQEVLSKSFAAHENVTSLEVIYDEKWDDYSKKTKMVTDLETQENNSYIKDEDVLMYITQNDFLIEFPDGDISPPDTDEESMAGIRNRMENQQNPLTIFKKVNGKIHEKFDMVENKDEGNYTFTFNGTEEDVKQLGEIIFYYEATGDGDFSQEELDMLDVDIHSLDISFVINSSTYLLEKIEENITHLEANGDEKEISIRQTFKNYDDIGEIKKLAATSNEADTEENEATGDDVADLADKEIKKMEKGASAYVDALIQATVFQDQKGFIKAAPDSMSEEQKKSEAELQQESFKEIYKENTKNNMDGTGVTDEEVASLADAFIKALSKTKYEVVEANVTSSEDIIVTLSIEGIDDQAVYQKTDDMLDEVFEKGEIAQEDLISKNMEILVNNYKEVTLNDPIEVDVHVKLDGDKYLVLLQDEYLVGGFVQ